MNYYCLIAGLPDLLQDNSKNAPELDDFLSLLHSELSPKDASLLKLLLMETDNANLLALLANKEASINPISSISLEEWKENLANLEDIGSLAPKSPLASYMADFYFAMQDEEMAKTIHSKENYLASLYYEYGLHSKNSFVARWFDFNLNIKNVLTALACKKYKWDIKEAIVGNNSIAQTIKQNVNAHDFNLTNELEAYEVLVSIADEKNLLEREKRIDALKWNWLEENSFFNYFTIERVLVFWLRIQLLHRWDNLTPEAGQEIFRNLLQELKKDVKFE